MALGFGIFVISTLIILKIASFLSDRLKNSTRFKNLTDYGTGDKICRIIQYTASGIVGGTDPNIKSIHRQLKLSSIVTLSSLQQLSQMMSKSRKIIRFIRAPLNLQSVLNKQIKINFSTHISTLSTITILSKYISDICDIIFYFTDHFSVFYWLGYVQGYQLNNQLQMLGHIMWILGAFLLFIAALSGILKIKILYPKTYYKEKQFKLCLIDILTNVLEFMIGITFIYTAIARRETISMMVIVSSVAKLMKFRIQ